MLHGNRFRDLSGQIFGRLMVLGFSGKRPRGESLWNCRCSCGGQKVVATGALQSGHTASCGCLWAEAKRTNTRTHGLSKQHPLYGIWCDIRKRTSNPNSAVWQYYGGRGIKLCDRWQDFVAFATDMGERPSASHSVDRIDVDGDYEPGNCRWADRHEQANNRRDNLIIPTPRGEMTIPEAARAFEVPVGRLYRRHYKGWAPEDILFGRAA